MNPLSSALLTDLYQLTMLQAYFERGMRETAVFELFVRKLPPGREFLVAAGLEQALGFLAGLRFGAEELDWIGGCGIFKPAFARELAKLRFTGDVHAMPEGTVFYPQEPILRVTAPLPEAQLVEHGRFAGGLVTLETDPQPGEALLRPAMKEGARLAQPTLDEARAHCRAQLGRLPRELPYPVQISPGLRSLAAEVDRRT